MSMLWMETYFLYFSVRLGVIVISVLSFVSVVVPSILLFAIGLTVLDSTIKLFNDNEQFRQNGLVKLVANEVKNDSNSFKIILQLYFFTHMAASVLAFYGSLKLKKYFLLPLIFFELVRVIFCLAFHILIMTVSKNRVNLGILITTTLAGGFLILFLGYNWATCVALYQIINLINSERYKALYGDDPFKPLIPDTYNPMVTENVRVLVTPNNRDIDEQKKRNILFNAANRNHLSQPQPIISVLPVNYLENNLNSNRNNAKWKESHWPTTTVQTPPTAERYPLPTVGNPSQNRNDNNVNYNNWQWSELTPGVTDRNKKNIFVGSRWNY